MAVSGPDRRLRVEAGTMWRMSHPAAVAFVAIVALATVLALWAS